MSMLAAVLANLALVALPPVVRLLLAAGVLVFVIAFSTSTRRYW